MHEDSNKTQKQYKTQKQNTKETKQKNCRKKQFKSSEVKPLDPEKQISLLKNVK
jgi:hypothetical protein